MNTKQVTVECGICHEIFRYDVSAAGFDSWRAGTPIQKALPELDANKRELLISGMCGRCFDKLFDDYE